MEKANPGVNPHTNQPTEANPYGMNSLTSIDIIGHEMTHGVTSNSAGLQYSDESGGLNEATSAVWHWAQSAFTPVE